jgi:predicted Zn-dependent peptidase
MNTLRRINRTILYDFYNKYYRPNNSYLIIEGHLNFRELVKKVSHYLNIWERKNIKFPEFPPVNPYDKKIIYLIDSPNVKRPFICLGNSIGNNSNNEFFSLIVLNQILGGTTTSRLFMNLRESKEYAFDARSYINFYKKSGIFAIEVEVKPEFVKQSIQECLSEIEKINHQSIPIFELEQAKYYLIGNFPLQLNSIEGFSEHLMKKIVFDFKDKLWDNYQENIMMIDQTRISSVAKKYFSRSPAIIVVGNRKKILEPLLDFEIIELYDVDGNLKYRIEKGI